MYLISKIMSHPYEIKGVHSLETLSSITPATAWLAQRRPFGNVGALASRFQSPGIMQHWRCTLSHAKACLRLRWATNKG